MASMSASDLAARRIREVRQRRGWTVKELADKCAEAGVPSITATVITNLETRRRSTREITLDELFALARVLQVPPPQLMIPVGADEALEVVPGAQMGPTEAVEWITGVRNLDAEETASGVLRERFPAHKSLARIDPESTLDTLRLLGAAESYIRWMWRHPYEDESIDINAGDRRKMAEAADKLMVFAAHMSVLGHEPPGLDSVAEILERYGLPSTLAAWREQARNADLGDDGEDLDGEG